MSAPEQQLSTGCASMNRSKSTNLYSLNFLYKNWSARKHIWSCNVLRVIFPISAFPVICHWCWQSLPVNDHNPHQVGKTGSLLLGRCACFFLGSWGLFEGRPLLHAVTEMSHGSASAAPEASGSVLNASTLPTPCPSQYEDRGPPLSLKQLV